MQSRRPTNHQAELEVPSASQSQASSSYQQGLNSIRDEESRISSFKLIALRAADTSNPIYFIDSAITEAQEDLRNTQVQLTVEENYMDPVMNENLIEKRKIQEKTVADLIRIKKQLQLAPNPLEEFKEIILAHENDLASEKARFLREDEDIVAEYHYKNLKSSSSAGRTLKSVAGLETSAASRTFSTPFSLLSGVVRSAIDFLTDADVMQMITATLLAQGTTLLANSIGGGVSSLGMFAANTQAAKELSAPEYTNSTPFVFN